MIESIIRGLIVGTLLGFIKKHIIYRRKPIRKSAADYQREARGKH